MSARGVIWADDADVFGTAAMRGGPFLIYESWVSKGGF